MIRAMVVVAALLVLISGASRSLLDDQEGRRSIWRGGRWNPGHEERHF